MSGTTEEATVPEIIFKGTDGNECEAFIVAIQNYAFFGKGWDEDHHWMLRFARTCLRGKALRWYATLDPSIQKDWYLFVKALFDQYPLVEEPRAAEIATPIWSATTFSPVLSTVALPPNPDADRKAIEQKVAGLTPRQYDTSGTGQQIGILRIVNEQEANIPQYIWWQRRAFIGDSCPAITTTKNHEALVVSFLPSPSATHTIAYLGSKEVRTLAFPWRWSDSDPDPEYYAIHNYYRDNPGITPSMNESGYITKVWHILADGTLQASLSWFSRKSTYVAFEEIKFTTTEVHVDTSGANIRFVKPGALLEQDKPDRNPAHPFVRARIVFEPL